MQLSNQTDANETGASEPSTVVRDNAQKRAEFLDELRLEKPKIAAEIEKLDQLPYDLPEMFPNLNSWWASSKVKKRVKLIKVLEPLLSEILLEGEDVLYVTHGVYNRTIEALFMGALFAAMINKTVFIFTNYRIILLNSDSKHRPRHMKWQIPYDEIKSYRNSFISGATVIKLQDRKKYVFTGVPKHDRKPVRELVRSLADKWENADFSFPHFACRDNLCPSCYQPVRQKTYECECGDQFIKPMMPTSMSMALPCLGDFYLGHYLIACWEMFGMFVTWLLAIGVLLNDKFGMAGIGIASATILFAHGMDALLTHHVASKGLISIRNAWGRKG